MADEIFDLLEDLFDRRRDKKGKKGKGGKVEQTDERPAAPSRAAAFIFCSDCGTKNDEGARFCHDCGALLPAPGAEPQCPSCGRPAAITAKFCNSCGTRLSGA